MMAARAKRPMPEPLAQRLTDRGLIRLDRARKACRIESCDKCDSRIWLGTCGPFALRLDIAPLNALGELAVLMLGGDTVRMFKMAGQYELHERWPESIKSTPAGTSRQFDVLAVHLHHRRIAPELTAASVLPPPAGPVSQLSDRPPF